MSNLLYPPPAETYVEADISDDDDSTMATENGSSLSFSTEDEDGDDLVQLAPNVKLSQKMAIDVTVTTTVRLT